MCAWCVRLRVYDPNMTFIVQNLSYLATGRTCSQSCDIQCFRKSQIATDDSELGAMS